MIIFLREEFTNILIIINQFPNFLFVKSRYQSILKFKESFKDNLLKLPFEEFYENGNLMKQSYLYNLY